MCVNMLRMKKVNKNVYCLLYVFFFAYVESFITNKKGQLLKINKHRRCTKHNKNVYYNHVICDIFVCVENNHSSFFYTRVYIYYKM